MRVYKDAYVVNDAVIDEIQRSVYDYDRELPKYLIIDLIRIISKRKKINQEQM